VVAGPKVVGSRCRENLLRKAKLESRGCWRNFWRDWTSEPVVHDRHGQGERARYGDADRAWVTGLNGQSEPTG